MEAAPKYEEYSDAAIQKRDWMICSEILYMEDLA
jgi:hypothetical protein